MAISLLFWAAAAAGLKIVDELLDNQNKNQWIDQNKNKEVSETFKNDYTYSAPAPTTIKDKEYLGQNNNRNLSFLDMEKSKFHITSFSNLDSIIENGLLSPNELKKQKIYHNDSAGEFVPTKIFKQNLYSPEYGGYSNNSIRFGGLKTPTFENWFNKNDVINGQNCWNYIGFITNQNNNLKEHKKQDELYETNSISIKDKNIKGCLIFSDKINPKYISEEQLSNYKAIADKIGVDTYICSIGHFTGKFKYEGKSVNLAAIKI